jgi:hypothetical protein
MDLMRESQSTVERVCGVKAMVTRMKSRDQLWRWSSMPVSIFRVHEYQADMPVYAAWMHPELEKKGWNTVLNKGEIYNNCTYTCRE